jgi:hypothetical protein
VVSLPGLRTGRFHFPENIPDTHFCERLGRFQVNTAAESNASIQNANDNIGNRNQGLPACNSDKVETIFHNTCIINKFRIILLLHQRMHIN